MTAPYAAVLILTAAMAAHGWWTAWHLRDLLEEAATDLVIARGQRDRALGDLRAIDGVTLAEVYPFYRGDDDGGAAS